VRVAFVFKSDAKVWLFSKKTIAIDEKF
jgi:hypothetical protein